MKKAIWNNVVLAKSDNTIEIEGNDYFPPSSLNREYLKEISDKSTCPWKGTASYYDIVVDGKTNSGAAWYYPIPNEKAKEIKDHVAFWKGVEIK
ncbi:MAG: DUF427 domain-containing protein [Flavobacteriales bacterium]